MSRAQHRNPQMEQFWQEAVAAWQKSGLSVRAFCAGRGLAEPSFYSWRRELARRAQGRAKSPPRPRLVPVRVVTAQLGRDPLSGDLFVFKNRRGDRLKILAWQGDGYALYLRRLEKGTFVFPTTDAAEVSVTATELAMILGGIDLGSARRRPRYAHPTTE